MPDILDYTIRPLARISAGRAGEVVNYRSAHQQIPGSVIRGALGGAWINDPAHGSLDEARASWLERVIPYVGVRQAVPTLKIDDETLWPRLEHLSLTRPKFPAREDWLDLAHHTANDGVIIHKSLDLPGDTEEGRGWRWLDPNTRLTVDSTRSQLERGVPKLVTRPGPAGRDGDERGGMLFTREALRRLVILRGTVVLDDRIDDEVRRWVGGSLRLSIGGQRSTMGRARWSTKQGEAPTANQVGGGRAVVVLQSPAILVDEHGSPTTDLHAELDRRTSAGAVARTWSRTTTVFGWNGVAGVARPADRALAAGSVAVLFDWAQHELDDLIRRGIGVRRDEGYGEVWFPGGDSGERGGAPGYAPGQGKTESQKQAKEPDRCDELARLLRASGHERLLNQIVGVARELLTAVEAGDPVGLVNARVSPILDLPWARDLGPDSRAALGTILRRTGTPDEVKRVRGDDLVELTTLRDKALNRGGQR